MKMKMKKAKINREQILARLEKKLGTVVKMPQPPPLLSVGPKPSLPLAKKPRKLKKKLILQGACKGVRKGVRKGICCKENLLQY